jgi:DNA-binding ferritin-like protein (Dps family)
MTKRNRIILLSAALLAVLVIISAVIALGHPGADEKTDTASLILSCCIIAAGILSVVVVFLTKVRKGRYEKQLSAEYYSRYEIVRDAVANSQLAGATKAEIRGDLLDLLMSAQEAGKAAESVVGDPDAFAGEIIRSYSKPAYMAVLGLFDTAIAFAAFVLGVTVILWFEKTKNSFFSVGIGIDLVFFFALIAAAVLPLTKSLTSTRRNWAYFLPVAFGIAFVLITMLLREWFYSAAWVRACLDETVRMIPNAFMLAVYMLCVVLLPPLKHRLRLNMLKRKRE